MGRANEVKGAPLIVNTDNAELGGINSFSNAIPLLEQDLYGDDNPPAYTDSAAGPATQLEDHLVQRVFYRNVSINNDINSQKSHRDAKGSVKTVLSHSITSDPNLLQDFVASEARLMPSPTVRMMGTHTVTRRRDNKNETETVTDFDITVSAADLLASPWRRIRVVENSTKAYRGGRTRSIATGFKADSQSTCYTPSLQEWCHRFCASSTSLKTFTISRQVINRDDTYLINALTGVLRSTSYRGSISVTFPVGDRATILMSNHPINRYRTNRYIWWACVILQLWIITWPLLWLMTRHWEVITVDWPCKIFQGADGRWPDADEEIPELIHHGKRPDHWIAAGGSDVRLATMSEMAWVEEWRGAIVRAAEDRRQGMLHGSDKDSARAAQQRHVERAREIGPHFTVAGAGGLMEAAVGLLRGASDVLRDSRMAGGWGYDI